MAENQVSPPDPATLPRIVVIGGSAGSIDVLLRLLPALQSPLRLAMLIVVHRKNTADSALSTLLSMKAGLLVREVEDKDVLLPGQVYVAPADYHLLLEQDGTLSLDDSEKVHYSRPAIDVTFESAADVYGPAVVGVLLSGANADGTAGLRAIKQAGGITIAQHPDTAQTAFMPQQAIRYAPIDWIFDVAELTDYLNRFNAALQPT